MSVVDAVDGSSTGIAMCHIAVFEECRLLAQPGPSAPSGTRSDHGHIADLRRWMSAHRRIADL